MIERSHDPYRSITMNVPQFGPDLPTPVDSPVRVLAVVDRYPPWVNAGAEWMLHSILRRLVDLGHTCTVAAPIGEEHAVVDGVSVFPAEMADQLGTVNDVLIGHLLWTREIVTLARDHALPLLYLLHNDSQVSHWDLREANITALVPNSEWVKARAVEDGWQGPMFVCRPPVFCADYAVQERTADRDFVTLVNPIPEKGAILFYELANRRRRENFLAVTGAYGHQHRPPHYVDNVTMIPPTGNMRDDVYAKTRVLLMPSSYESWGRCAVEAMAAGVPVIAHPTAGLVEALGDAAVFVDREDVNGWMDALDRLAEPAFYKRAQKRGRARAKALEVVTDADLVEFDRWVRMAATLAPASVSA